MEEMKRRLANGPVFVGSYLALMFPTYVLPYFGSNSAIVNAGLAAVGGPGFNILMFMHLACLGGLIFVTWARGSAADKSWIAVFPVLAAVFDMVPGFNWIPLIPTFLHLAAIVMGASANQTRL